MEKVVKLEGLDEENLKKWQEFLVGLKIVNNPAEGNKHIHFELSKALVHWFLHKIIPRQKSGLCGRMIYYLVDWHPFVKDQIYTIQQKHQLIMTYEQ
jgi:hypothetical protein